MEDQYRKIQMRTILIFTVLIVAVSLFLVFLYSRRSDSILKNTSASLLQEENEQRKENTESLLEQCETDVAFLYGDSDAAAYSPLTGSEEGKEKLTERIDETGMKKNYTDFAVVFSDDTSIGRLSETTSGLYSEESIYDGFSSLLGSEKEKWVPYLKGSKSRLYYLEQFNDNAIAIVSYDKKIFSSLYAENTDVKGLDSALVDTDGSIVYCSDATLINTAFNQTVFKEVSAFDSGSTESRGTCYFSDTCSNGMKVITAMDVSDLLSKNRRALIETFIVMAVMAAVILAYGMHEIRAVYASTNSLFGSLKEEAEHDQMTGLLTKTQFAINADHNMNVKGPENDFSRCTFTILDLDNFKSINDGFGHIAGDEVIREFARLLKEVFNDKRFMIGRLGGDEFGVMGCFDIWDDETIIHEINSRLWKLRYRFRTSEVGKRFSIPVLSYSSGTVISKQEEKTFSELYKRADSLLYNGKKNGKGKDINEFSAREDDHEAQN